MPSQTVRTLQIPASAGREHVGTPAASKPVAGASSVHPTPMTPSRMTARLDPRFFIDIPSQRTSSPPQRRIRRAEGRRYRSTLPTPCRWTLAVVSRGPLVHGISTMRTSINRLRNPWSNHAASSDGPPRAKSHCVSAAVSWVIAKGTARVSFVVSRRVASSRGAALLAPDDAPSKTHESSPEPSSRVPAWCSRGACPKIGASRRCLDRIHKIAVRRAF